MTTASTILNRLKDETTPMHQHIEENEYATAIMTNRLTMDKYKEYLVKFHGFIKPLEEKLLVVEQAPGSVLSDPLRNKTSWLEHDLRALGMDQSAIDNLPQCAALPDLSTRARALGCLYVLEGSTLGGQMITKKLSQYLPIDPEVNGRYFNSYGANTRDRWQAFRQELQAEADNADKEAQMIEAARETFILLDRWITDTLPPAQ